uniref:hypothetical protein n=1 Tax=Streptomyces rimosus TaxID=1927 RepID=UPI0018FEAB05
VPAFADPRVGLVQAPQEHRDGDRSLMHYIMNGEYADQGGPRFDVGQQPISGSWWVIGPSDDPPYGLQTSWGIGNYRPEQREITDRMLMR